MVFSVSFALYKPERIEAAAQETMDDEWVGYFFALEPFDGRRYATETGDDYDFGVPGVPMFVTITDILPGERAMSKTMILTMLSARPWAMRPWAVE